MNVSLPGAPLPGSPEKNVSGLTGYVHPSYDPAPSRWHSPDHLRDFIVWCREVGVNDATFGSRRRILGKKDGRYRPVVKRQLTHREIMDLIALLKPGAILDRGSTYRGSHAVLYDVENGLRIRMRVTIGYMTGENDGEMHATVRLIPDFIPTAEQLAIPQVLLDAVDYKYGLGLVCGKMESGKTWTFAAILNQWLSDPVFYYKILHYGTPIEFMFDTHPGADQINQIEVPTNVATYALGLKAAKSQSPDKIVLEEVNDFETMSMLIDSAQSGIAVFGTLHISRVADLPGNMMTYYPDADQRKARLYAALQSLKVIIVQRLEPAVIDGDPSRPAGRVCLREYLVLDNAVRKKILDQPIDEWTQVLDRLVHTDGVSMDMSAKAAYEAGRLDKGSYDRIISGRA